MIASTEQKYKALIDALWDKTVGGKILWEDTSEEDVYSTKLAPYVLRISSEEREGTTDYAVHIFNTNGHVVDYFTDENLRQFYPSDRNYPNYFSLLREMHRKAARSVSGAEQALDSILSNLGVDASNETPGKDDILF